MPDKHSENFTSHNVYLARSRTDIREFRQLIKASFNRSKQYGVNPKMKKAPEKNRLSPSQLTRRIKSIQSFFDIAVSQMNTIYDLLKRTGFCVCLADHEGYVLKVLGDDVVLQQYESRNCLPGYRWREKDVGTCAIGLVLETRCSVQLSGRDMYAVSARDITNSLASAAPIFNADAQLLGVIVLSGLASQVTPHTLGMVNLAAATIRSRLSERERARELALKNDYMTALLESDDRGVIALDRTGSVIQLNNKATLLLKELISHSKSVTDVLQANKELMTILRSGEGFWEREFTYAWGDAKVSLISSLDPVKLSGGGKAGGLLLLMEKKRVLNLVNKMVGSQAHFTFGAIIGESPAMKEALRVARVAAKGSAAVLLCGETGTGKELFAQAIHNHGHRRDKPFVVINCGAIPKELFESELFGYVDGAFTGAKKGGRPGKFELADGGTLFLDEIGDMSLDMQVKILRALQSGEIHRVGGSTPVIVNLRIIAATNVNLDAAIAENRFRKDLFYRISTIRIDIPPLRERGGDIVRLAHAFLSRMGKNTAHKDLVVSPDVVKQMKHYKWPGNIRQLENAVERAVNMAEGGEIRPGDLGLPEADETSHPLIPKHTTLLKELERHVITTVMAQHNGNVRKVSGLLGISRPTLYKKLQTHGIKFR